MVSGTDRPQPAVAGEAVLPQLDAEITGQLAATPLARLLVAVAAQRVTGILRIDRGKVRKVVYLRRGTPTFVDSNLRNETLGAYLVAQGQITDDQLAQGVAHARSKKLKLGQALTALGFTEPSTISAGLHAQTQLKLASALRWTDGEFAFKPGDDFSGRVPDLPTEPVPLVLAALKRFVTQPSLTAELDRVLRLTAEGQRFRDAVEAIFGRQLLDCSARGLSLRQTLKRPGVDFADTCVAVSALRIAGLATLDSPTPTVDTPAAMGQGGREAAAAPPIEGVPLPAIPPALALEPQGETPEELRRKTFDGLLPVTAPLASELPAPEAPLPELEDQHTGDDQSARTLRIRVSPRPESSETPTASWTTATLDEARTLANRSAPRSIDLEDLEPAARTGARSEPELELDQMITSAAPAVDYDSGVFELDGTEGAQGGSPTALRPGANPLVSAIKQAYENVHDKSYYDLLGVAPSAPPEHVESAYRQLSERFGRGPFTSVELTAEEDRQRTELFRRIEQASEVLLDPLSRRSYDERLRAATTQPIGNADGDTFGAELAFQDGQNRLRAGDGEGAVRAFTQAIESNPDQPDYHAHCGWALFLHRGRGAAGAQAARPCFEQALAIAPDDPGVHELAARVETEMREHRRAAGHLVSALDNGPPRLDLFDLLRDALSALGDYVELERQYRTTLFRLRATDPEATIPLWIDLAYLHQEKLENPKEAQIALDVASRLAPDDPSVQAARASLGQQRASLAEQMTRIHQRLLKAQGDPTPIKRLWEPSLRAGDARLQLDIAALLNAFDLAGDEQQRAYRARPTRLKRAAGHAASLVDRLREPGDDATVEALVAELAPVLCEVHPVTLEDLGSSDLELLAEIGLPDTFRDVVRYVGDQLGTGIPDIYLSSKVPTMVPAPTMAKRLLVGQGLLETDDEEAIAFAAARALSCTGEGRRHAFGRRARTLKIGFIAAFSLCRGAPPSIPDPDGAIARFRQALEPRVDHARLARHFERLGGGTLNLSQWVRAVRCTAGRVGMLLCQNPGRALQLVDRASTRANLLAFVFDPRFREAREALKLSTI